MNSFAAFDPPRSVEPAHAAAAPASLAERARADGIELVLALFVDLTGKPCGKMIPVEALDRLQSEGIGFAGYSAGFIGHNPGDPELMAMPDAASYTPLPFIRPG